MREDVVDSRLEAVVEHLQRQDEERWADESRKRTEQGLPPLRRTTFRPEAALTMYLVCPVCGEAQATLDEAKTLARVSRRPEDFVDLCLARIEPHLDWHRRTGK